MALRFSYCSAAASSPLGLVRAATLIGLFAAGNFQAYAAPVDVFRNSPGITSHGASTAGGAASGGVSSQGATAATAAAAQAAQAALTAQKAQDSFLKATAAFQAQRSAQAAAHLAALNDPLNNLGSSTNPLNGLGTGALDPVGGATAAPASAIQLVTLGSGSKGQLTLTSGGTLTLPSGTTGSDQISITGSGTITTSSGTTSFTGSAANISSLGAGAKITLLGDGAISFLSKTNDSLSVLFNSGSAYTTTGTVLSTVGYILPSSWKNVGALSQSTGAGGTTVTVTQDGSQALLNWTTFNIGKNTTLDFDQSAGGTNVGSWVAINRILDPSLAPSTILGNIQASGQVYVINQNGIIFGGSSQVNTHALVASTLPINSNLIGSGLLTNPYAQFLFSSEDIPSFQGSPEYNPATDPNVLPGAVSQPISVALGAEISTPTNLEHVGGKIALIAPSVDNEGLLSSPDGQVILAAGQQVGFTAHPSIDPSLRGLDVAIGADGGTATNGVDGFIDAPRADVTLAGQAVNQLGFVDATTSVALNGRIDLLAEENLAPKFNLDQNSYDLGAASATGGTVTLGANSLTEILPEYGSTDTVVGTSLALPSQIYVGGETLHLATSAQLVAPNATATFSIGILNTAIALPVGASSTNAIAENETVPSGLVFLAPGQVYLDQGSNIDVSGSNDVTASVAQNIVAAQLRGAELANSPLQQNGPLRGQTVDVDITKTGTNPDGTTWIGSPIGDLTGYANLVQRTVGELTSAGGSVDINTNGSVVLQPTSTINVSGGSINFQGAVVQTTRVITQSGQLLDISQATPDQIYQGIYTGFTTTSPRFGVTQNFQSPLETGSYYESGYTEGGNGGSLTISSPTAALDGSLYGNTTAGAHQQSLPPAASSFHLSLAQIDQNSPLVNVLIQSAPGGQGLVDAFDSGATPVALSADRQNNVYLSPSLISQDGFGNTSITTDGDLTVEPDAVVSASPSGSLTLSAANVNVFGQIYVPGGLLSIQGLEADQFTPPVGPNGYDAARGNVEIHTGAVLSTAGLSFDEFSGEVATGTLPFRVNGGSIAISAAATTLDTGSTVDVSGGAARSSAGKVFSGNGGKISLSGSFSGSDGTAEGGVVLNGLLEGYGVGQGGKLSISAPGVEVGGGSAAQLPTGIEILTLAPDFFSEGGFSSFSVTGAEGVQISGEISPVLIKEVVTANGNSFGLSQISSSQLPSYPAAPVNLSFSAPGALATPATLDLEGIINAGATSSVTLLGQLVDVSGEIIAPGGSVSIAGNFTSQSSGVPTPPLVNVHLGPQSLISTAGEELTTTTLAGGKTYKTGEVLAGGTITISGDIVGEAGANLNADGAQATLDVPLSTTTLYPGSALMRATPFVSELVASNGGAISLNGLQEMYFDGQVSARAGNATASGGTLTLGSGLAPYFTTPPDAGLAEFFLKQQGTYLPEQDVVAGDALTGVPSTGGGFFTVNQFVQGGFDSLVLNGNVEFQGNIALHANQKLIITPDSNNGTIFADGSAEQTIDLSAPYINIGSTTLTLGTGTVSSSAPAYAATSTTAAAIVPGLAAPTSGSATINLTADDLIDVSFLSLQGFNTTNFSVANGDLRGGGLLYAAGVLNLTAGQIYTPTAADFTVAAFDAGSQLGTVNIFAGASREVPLSAGGTINIYGSIINQDGVLRAPFGEINLGALPSPTTGLTPVLAGVTVEAEGGGVYQSFPDYSTQAPVTQQLTLGATSITSVSGVDPTTGKALDLPYGTNLNGVQFLDPTGADITAGGLKAKQINLNGNAINDQTGAVVDLSGGGDLFAYRFNSGLGGTNDILASSTTSFAILPNSQANYAPIDLTVDSLGALPYANSSLTNQVGSQVYLAGGNGLAAGIYTLLPARYALLPGAYLVTPTATTPAQTSQNPDGSVVMAGYRVNSLNANQQIVPNITGFEVDSSSVVAARAEYDISSADTFLKASAVANNQPVPRLPVDAGQLVFDATNDLQIQTGAVLRGSAGSGGLGSTVDIGSSNDIYIEADNVSGPAGALTLDASSLTGFGADSLLIGGIRGAVTADGTAVTVLTDNIFVENNAGSPLAGPDIILVSKQDIAVGAGAVIEQTGTLANAENLVIGNASVVGSGDGTLLRVSSDPTVQISRLGVDTTDTAPDLVIGGNVALDGAALIIDSTAGTTIDPTAAFDRAKPGQSLVLDSGRISFQLDPNVALPGNGGLEINEAALQNLQSSVQTLALVSYSTIDLYGAGTLGALDSKGQPVAHNLSLTAAGIRGYDSNGGTATLNAQSVSIDNAVNQVMPTTGPTLPTGAASNSLVINANTIDLGVNTFTIQGYSTTTLAAANGMQVEKSGALVTAGALDLMTPVVTGATGVQYSFTAGEALQVEQPLHPGTVTLISGLGDSFALTGSTVNVASSVLAPSGTITAHATAGNVELQSGSTLNAAGTESLFGSVVRSSNGGVVNLTSNGGDVILDAGSLVTVSAPKGGNGGAVNVSAANGTFTAAANSLQGNGGTGGTGASFHLVAGSITDFSNLAAPITAANFQAVTLEALTGDVTINGAVGAPLSSGTPGLTLFSLTADGGQIAVDSTINAAGATGGTIDLYASGDVILTGQAVLSAAGKNFDNAGKGGLIDLETRGAGTLGIDIETGSVLDLSVAANENSSGALSPTLVAANAALGKENGELYLRAPQTQGGANVLISAISGTVKNASSITVEGYQVITDGSGIIDNTSANGNVEGAVASNVAIFGGSTVVNSISAGLVGTTVNAAYASNSTLLIEPGEEIVNPNGNITLAANWDLSGVRTSQGLPGTLTIRAANNLIFTGSLTDGFAYNSADAENVATSPYTWDVLAGPSWSYRLVAGAAFNSSEATPAAFGSVQSLAALGLDNSSLTNGTNIQGSLLLGKDIPVGFNYRTTTATTAGTYGQLIRTGTGNITIDTGGSLDLLNQIVSIYTAGSRAPSIAGFDSPTGTSSSAFERTVYGQSIDPASTYTAQYTENGGNLSINAQQDIEHLTQNGGGDFIIDTSLQLPTNWLYRRGATASPGAFDTVIGSTGTNATTTWWIDFSNFFEGVGTLGGGNLSMAAGGNIVNVDAVAATNARLPYADAGGNTVADDAANLIELGGGNLTVTAGNTLLAGDYYVERGEGTINAGAITSVGDTVRIPTIEGNSSSASPLPLTLFVGDSSFNVSSAGDLTLGSAVNPFLLPQGIDNGFADSSFFSTYGPNSGVNLSSLLGTITIRGGLGSNGGTDLSGSLVDAYLSNASGYAGHGTRTSVNSSNHTPFTLTLESNGNGTGLANGILAYSKFFSLSPPIFRAAALSGNIQYQSDQLLAPSSQGTLQLLAAGSIDGAYTSNLGVPGQLATITISDTDPTQLPGLTNPVGLGTSTALVGVNNPSLDLQLRVASAVLGEQASFAGESVATLQSFHTASLLHNNDTTVQIDTANGDIGDFTLISPEKVAISSGLDLQDVAFYIQNNNANDLSLVTANRDITLYDPNSTALVGMGATNDIFAAAGDLQISGPGTLEVLAGRNLDLGVGSGNGDGTGVGLTSIGNSRNPYLPFGGANLIAGAGVGNSSGLATSSLNFTTFIDSFLNPNPTVATDDPLGDEAARYLPDLAARLNLSGSSDQAVFAAFQALPPQQQDALALDVFYDVIRDAGRDHNDPTSANFGTYAEANAAIADLFPTTTTYAGDISLTSREIQTTNGGDIDLLAPGGGVNVGLQVANQPQDQGILTVDGGNISIFTHGDVNVGTSRIFTLHGGNEIIYSQSGDIDAGNGSKTVQSAPPTRVLVDPTSGNVQLDLAGLATGSGIGVLATVVGAPPGDVDLIAPTGIVDAGDAGIRSSGNINIAAVLVLNASNIQVSGKSSGVPTTAAPNISGALAAASAAGSAQNAAAQTASQQQPNAAQQTDLPSVISIQVVGYGGGDDAAVSSPLPSSEGDLPYVADGH